jgi:aspartate/methionine/tyrosine aminotransferase
LFSQRTHWNVQPGDLSLAWSRRQSSGRPCFDLTLSNPTIAGFALDKDRIAQALADGVAASYDPVPFGLHTARAAVCGYYGASHGVDVPLERVLLTVSTSEAYSFLFRLLCDPADEILYLQPGYPLFDYLAALDSVELKPVHWLQDEDGWHLDRGGLDAALSPRTRAVLLVHPNNPTGHFTTTSDQQWLDRFCADHGLAVIVDEVFLDYAVETAGRSFLADSRSALTFVLSGVSKVSGLPQMKLAWIAMNGPDALVTEAISRMDVIADTYLSVSTPTQYAVSALLHARIALQPQILTRLKENLLALDGLLEGQTLVSRSPVEGGWYALLRVPAYEGSEASAIRLLQNTGVYVHPGAFFGFASQGVWVVSLLTAEGTFRSGLERLIRYVQTLE